MLWLPLHPSNLRDRVRLHKKIVNIAADVEVQLHRNCRNRNVVDTHNMYEVLLKCVVKKCQRIVEKKLVNTAWVFWFEGFRENNIQKE